MPRSIPDLGIFVFTATGIKGNPPRYLRRDMHRENGIIPAETVSREAPPSAERKRGDRMKHETETRQKLVQVALSREEFAVSKFIATLSFRRSLWGLEEEGVWRAIERLVSLYEDSLTAERGKRELAERKLEAMHSREDLSNG
jgi:hypothetical protein